MYPKAEQKRSTRIVAVTVRTLLLVNDYEKQDCNLLLLQS